MMDEVNKHNFLALLNTSIDEDNPMKPHAFGICQELLRFNVCLSGTQ